MKRIVFNLRREWFEKIATGEKAIEYRRICEHWARKLGAIWPIGSCEKEILRKGLSFEEPVDAVFRLGYKSGNDIVRRITKVDIGPCPYDGWDGEWFRVHFEDVSRENARERDGEVGR